MSSIISNKEFASLMAVSCAAGALAGAGGNVLAHELPLDQEAYRDKLKVEACVQYLGTTAVPSATIPEACEPFKVVFIWDEVNTVREPGQLALVDPSNEPSVIRAPTVSRTYAQPTRQDFLESVDAARATASDTEMVTGGFFILGFGVSLVGLAMRAMNRGRSRA